MTFAHQRTSYVRYKRRPPSNCRAARWAWDELAKDGPIKTLWLGQGYWIAERPEGHTGSEFDEIEAEVVLWHSLPENRSQ